MREAFPWLSTGLLALDISDSMLKAFFMALTSNFMLQVNYVPQMTSKVNLMNQNCFTGDECNHPYFQLAEHPALDRVSFKSSLPKDGEKSKAKNTNKIDCLTILIFHQITEILSK